MKTLRFRRPAYESKQARTCHWLSDMTHIDDWLDEPAKDESERLAKEWLEHFRHPAKDEWLGAVLSCEYRGRRYRCTGASRMGDVWLAKDFSQENGYDLRVDVAECSAWQVEAKGLNSLPNN